METGVVNQRTRKPLETGSDEEGRRKSKRLRKRLNDRIHGTRSTSPESDKHGERSVKSGEVQISEESRFSSSKAKAPSEHELKNSSKESPNSKNQKVFMPVNDTLSTGLDYKTFHWVKRSSLNDDQVVKHVSKHVSG